MRAGWMLVIVGRRVLRNIQFIGQVLKGFRAGQLGQSELGPRYTGTAVTLGFGFTGTRVYLDPGRSPTSYYKVMRTFLLISRPSGRHWVALGRCQEAPVGPPDAEFDDIFVNLKPKRPNGHDSYQ